MIAGRLVIVIPAGVLTRAELEQFDALILETDDPVRLLTHLKHALENPWPEVNCGAGPEHEPEPPSEVEIALERAIFGRDLIDGEKP